MAMLAIALLAGCNSADPTVQKGDASDVPTSNDSQTNQVGSSSANATEAPQPPRLDENAVNEEGLIVLGSDEEPAGGASDSTPLRSEAVDETSAGLELGDSQPATQAVADSADAENATPEVVANQSTDDVIIEIPEKPADAKDGVPTLAASTSKIIKSEKKPPVEANVATFSELNQSIAEDWPKPDAVLFVSGQQHGYLEPCGCTGLENQKGGLIRRDTLLGQLRDRGWDLIPVDVGNQVRRIGRQPEIKFQSTVEAFTMMDYKAATLGVDDLKLSSIEVIQACAVANGPATFISANVILIDPSFFPTHRIVESGNRKIGITAVLGEKYRDEIQSSDVEITDPVESLKPVVAKLKEEGCDFVVLLAHTTLEDSAAIAQQVPGINLVVTAGGFGEPTLHAEEIPESEAVMVQVGTKGMYGGIVGIFDDAETPIRYQKIAISAQLKDSPRMLDHFAKYQERLKSVGFQGLGVTPVSHPTGRKFVGSETCGDCHTQAFEKWESTPHVHATDSVIAANNDRGGIPRHHDPECVSCHATGWHAQNFYPYETGFISPDQTAHLTGSGCENCHGPGKDHVDAEYGDVDVDNDTLEQLRQQMVIKLSQARDKCLECHDLDNSPDFHEEGAFDEYWEQVKHYGKD